MSQWFLSSLSRAWATRTNLPKIISLLYIYDKGRVHIKTPLQAKKLRSPEVYI